ncbi:MAG: hypothetical protein NTY48_01445 [Candidatus Diapherotrites archaeon]|nr:hypothetical protein [Candidatus Diapherotrites archaeon]
MKLLSFATGNFYRFVNQIRVVEYIDSLGIDGIEYTYGKWYDERPLTKIDKNILSKKLDTSLHIHFKFLRFPDRIEQDTLDFYKILNDYREVNAKRLVIHPHQIPSEKLIKIGQNNNVQFITENMPKRHKNSKRKNPERCGFEKVLNEHNHFGLCLDVSHSYSWPNKETKRIVDTWKDKIMQVHFSITNYQVNHLSTQHASKKFLATIKCLKELDVPIVIEENMQTINKKLVTKEINQIKKVIGIVQ